MTEVDWVPIFSTNKQYEAELLCGMLLEEGIEAIVVNKQDSFYLIGECELNVRRTDILRAKTLIEKYNS